MENWGLIHSFSACMTSKISQLKFGVHKFERVEKEWNRNRLKRIRGLQGDLKKSITFSVIFL